jgi:predicted TIM-barrel fold metal-dependent hydrolase
MSKKSSADVRAALTHPVVDADGHWLEPMPIFLDFLRDEGGPHALDTYRRDKEQADLWYRLTAAERATKRVRRGAWWVEPADTLDRATALLPKLFYDRLDELGIDFSIVYPSSGLGYFEHPDVEYRRAAMRAANKMTAELFSPYSDRLAAVGGIPMVDPQEAIDELEFCVLTLGIKVVMAPGHVNRQTEDGRMYVDSVALDSRHNYDSFFSRCVELGVAVTDHSTSLGWPERQSTTNYVSNHIGHFAASQHFNCRGIFLGGVVHRFPSLKFAFLEGGVGWGCNLLFDLIGHWEKRHRDALLTNLAPTNVDGALLSNLFAQHGPAKYAARFDEIFEHLSTFAPYGSVDELTEREGEVVDDFAATGVHSRDDLRDAFTKNFYFGCEADDPMTAVAFDSRLDAPLKPIFSSDVGHFDVPVMNEVVAEAFELVETGLLTEEQFQRFVFGNVVELHAGMNPRFFDGTVVEAALTDIVGSRGA